MWGPKYCPRPYHEGCRAERVVLRRSYGPARDSNNAYRSTYGVWNDSYGIRCGLWDDVLYQCARNCQPESKRRRNVTMPISKVATPNQYVRYKALAMPKTTGCGPNCKKSRCAATEPPYYYTKPYCTADKRRVKKRKAGTSECSPSVNIYTYSTMANVQDEVLDMGRYDLTMELKNIKEVEEPKEVEDLPTCERKCGECLEVPRESKGGDVEMQENGTHGSGLRSLARTRTVGSNTEEVSQAAEDPGRVLQDVSNTVLGRSEKMAPPVVPRLKTPTPIPRVAFLRPPKPRLKDVLEYEGDQLLTPWLPMPRTPRSIRSSSPVSLTSRRVPQSRIPQQTQKLLLGKVAPRLFTPPTTVRLTGTGSSSPRSSETTKLEKPPHNPNQLNPDENSPNLQPVSPPLQPFTSTPQEASIQSSKQTSKQSSKQTSEQSSMQSSKQSSKSDSLVTSISDFENSSRSTESYKSESIPGIRTPVICLCSLCGKCESINVGSQENSATIYRNNPLYSPGRALATTTVQNSWWRFMCAILEVLLLVVLAGILTVGMIPYVETVFRAYVADYCRCSAEGKGNGRPQVTADGLQSGVVKWVNCMMDDNRATLTPVR